MKIVRIREALRKLKQINQEIYYKSCVEGKGFSTGVICFRPQKDSDPKQISHRNKDVMCHVLKGHGCLRIKNRKIPLHPGTVCHIPKGTPHDFAAGKKGKMILLYSLITTGRK